MKPNIKKVPENELLGRMKRFTAEMDRLYPDWEICAFVGGISMYYLTGTICDGILMIKRGDSATLWVRRSVERAVLESNFNDIRKMTSFREVAENIGELPDTLYLDMSQATLEWYGIFSKYLKFEKTLPIDSVMLKTRAVKSSYEIEIIKNAGNIINRLLCDEVPAFFHAGISEAELGTEIYSLFIKNGYHGVSRFSMRNTDVVLGHIGFGESSLYPSIFNGASGTPGLCPAVPVLGSREITLKEGDLVYIDVGFGLEGYNVDKTLVYSYKKGQPEYVNDIHEHCLELERKAASMMRAGVKPSDIYNDVTGAVNPELRSRFMGTEGRNVPFLGHGVGLYVDEYPVITKKFGEPLEAGMTIAIEPKIGIESVGMVGSENTYLITEKGAESLTGMAREILLI